MKRVVPAFPVLGLLLVLFASSCVFGNSPKGARDELTHLANKVETASYAAVYRFAFTRQNPPGQTTRIEITQQPPVTVRKIEESTRSADNKPVTLKVWYLHNAQGDFACNEYPSIGVRCQKNPLARTTAGSEKLDVFFDTPREENRFADVRKITRPVRIQGQRGTCFEAVPLTASPEPTSSVPTVERYRYELCYGDDGILLSGKRTTLDDTGGAESAESFVEAVSISHVVDPVELRLPGKIVSADDLPK